MDTSYYHNFITLVQTGNMTQAAEILHITQPALSKQLKYLEAEFGAQLINIKRGQRGSNLQLTDAGKIFYEKAQQLCSIEESTYNAVQQLNSRIEGTLRIATSASRSTPIVQQYLPAFSMKYPSVHFEIYEGLMTNVVNQLINGNAELGIANIQMVDTDKFDILLTQEEHLYGSLGATLPPRRCFSTWDAPTSLVRRTTGGSSPIRLAPKRGLVSRHPPHASSTSAASSPSRGSRRRLLNDHSIHLTLILL